MRSIVASEIGTILRRNNDFHSNPKRARSQSVLRGFPPSPALLSTGAVPQRCSLSLSSSICHSLVLPQTECKFNSDRAYLGQAASGLELTFLPHFRSEPEVTKFTLSLAIQRVARRLAMSASL